jgi:curved DNA-binding protein
VFVDHYEVLQISPNADQETVHRVYRMQAQRFHPDNQESGDAAAFRRLSDAYQILSDPDKRAAYDEEHRTAQRRSARDLFEQSNRDEGVDGELHLRDEILSLLYKKRRCNPDQPSMQLRELEEVLAIRKEKLEFSLWFLKEGGFLIRTDGAKHTITMKGAELVESSTSRPTSRTARITEGSAAR